MTTEPIPYFEATRFRCQCGHRWNGYLAQDVAAKVWVAQAKALRCSGCGKGWRGIFLCSDASDAPTKPLPLSGR